MAYYVLRIPSSHGQPILVAYPSSAGSVTTGANQRGLRIFAITPVIQSPKLVAIRSYPTPNRREIDEPVTECLRTRQGGSLLFAVDILCISNLKANRNSDGAVLGGQVYG